MFSNRLVIAALGIGCIAAAAAGGYVASRQNVSDALAAAPVAQSAPSPAPTPAATTPADKPVQETEALVGDTAKAAPAAAMPVPQPASTARSSASTRRPEPEPRRDSRTPAATSPRAATQPPPLTSSWPSSANAQPPAQTTPAPSQVEPTPRPEERTPEPARAPEPPQKTFEELVVSSDSVIGLVNDSRITSETARIEDRVDAHVSRDVKVGDRVAIPAGAKVIGSVTQVDRGGKFKERARLGIRFHTIVLADGTRVPISTDTIYREGEAPGNSSAAKVGGGAVGGAILGAILGGAKGAAIGSTVGAGAGTAAVVAGDRNAAVMRPGDPTTVKILSPVTVTVER